MESPVFWNGLTPQVTWCFTSVMVLASMQGFIWHIGMYLHQLALGIRVSVNLALGIQLEVKFLSCQSWHQKFRLLKTKGAVNCNFLETWRRIKMIVKVTSKSDIFRQQNPEFFEKIYGINLNAVLYCFWKEYPCSEVLALSLSLKRPLQVRVSAYYTEQLRHYKFLGGHI